VDSPEALRSYLGGSHWCFLAFTPEQRDRLYLMIAENYWACADTAPSGKKVLKGVEFTPVNLLLWNGAECQALFVARDQWPPGVMEAGLRKHFGYECPDPDSNVFRPGGTPEEDALFVQQLLDEIDRLGD
jgi:hypothetical protein